MPEYQGVFIRPQGLNASTLYAKLRVRNDSLNIGLIDKAQAVAVRACTLWGVEAEGVGLRFIVRYACCWTHQVAAEVAMFVTVHVKYHDYALAYPHGGSYRLAKPFQITIAYPEFIHK